MNRWHLLAVDDEPTNLEIIAEFLDDPRIDLDLASSGEAAWQLLDAATTPYHAVILDRMMPGIDGMELLRRLKADQRFRRIPVVMQTAAAAPEQVREGIEAGAYYYLTKPYAPEALVAIVRAALANVEEEAAATRRGAHHTETLHLMDSGCFGFATLEEANRLACLLAALCPTPETVFMGLTELMINAVEHGNLGISYTDKTRLRRQNAWESEIAHRLTLPENRTKRARVAVQRSAEEITFTISDTGPGFDWRRYLDFAPERAFDLNGRGIAMARMVSFSAVDYLGSGSEVVARVKL